MNPDSCVSQRVNEREVKAAIQTLHILRTAWGDPNDNLQNLVRVLEVMYGIEYSGMDRAAMQNLEHVVDGMYAQECTRLDPEHVEEMRDEGKMVTDKFNRYIEEDMFKDVPEVSFDSSDVTSDND